MNLHISISGASSLWRFCWVFWELLLMPSTATAQQKFEIKNVAEKKLKHLPAGPLYWRVENFPTLAQAQAAAGETSLAAEVSGKVWLFTLGPKGGATPGGSKVAEIGPVPPITAPDISFASTTPAVRPGPRRRYIRIRVPKPFMFWPAGWVRGRRTASCMPMRARP